MSARKRESTSYYDLLGVGEDATAEEIKAAYHSLAKRLHPDQNSERSVATEALFRNINHAYEVLSKPDRRAAYDDERDSASASHEVAGYDAWSDASRWPPVADREPYPFRPSPPPQPQAGPPRWTRPDLTREQKWAKAAHVVSCVGLFFPPGNIILPLLVWLTRRRRYPLVDEHGKESLNFQVSVALYATPWVFISALPFRVRLLALLVLLIFDLSNVVQGARSAQEGRSFRYPLALRPVR